MRSLLPLLLLSAPLTTARAAFTWAPCTPEGSAKPPLLTPTAVTLAPDPPVIGGDVVFGVDGAAASAVASGTIGLRVKYEGVDLYEEQGPLCDKVAGKGCPIEAGQEARIEYRQELPPIAPPGRYAVRVIATTDGSSTREGDAVVCVDVEFEMVMPSAAAVAVEGAVGRAGGEGSAALVAGGGAAGVAGSAALVAGRGAAGVAGTSTEGDGGGPVADVAVV